MKLLAMREPFELSKTTLFCMRSRKEKRMYSQGIRRVNKELEVEHFLRQMKIVRIALRTLFTKTEMFLLRNNKSFVL